MHVTLLSWVVVVGVILVALAIDLFAFHRTERDVSMREALVSTAVWVALGLAFGAVVWLLGDSKAAGEYYTGFVLEKALSVENVFVFALVLGAFAVPSGLRHRVLFLGVLGALVLRGAFVAVGASLLDAFSWTVALFGGVLIVTGVRMACRRATSFEPGRNPVVRVLRRVVPVADEYHGTRLFVRNGGALVATPLLAAVVAVETTDVVFAVDSIPAIFGVTDEPFLVFTSNAFAMLGLRSLFFVLAGAMHRLWALTPALAGVLVLVGVKLLLTDVYHVPVWLTFTALVALLGTAVVVSLLFPRDAAHPEQPGRPGGEVIRV